MTETRLRNGASLLARGSSSLSFLVRLLPTFVPAIGGLFRTASFPADWWWWILPCLLPGFVVLELDKLIARKSHR